MAAIDKIDLFLRLIDPHAHAVKRDLWHAEQRLETERAGIVKPDSGRVLVVVGDRGPELIGPGSFLQGPKCLMS